MFWSWGTGKVSFKLMFWRWGAGKVSLKSGCWAFSWDDLSSKCISLCKRCERQKCWGKVYLIYFALCLNISCSQAFITHCRWLLHLNRTSSAVRRSSPCVYVGCLTQPFAYRAKVKNVGINPSSVFNSCAWCQSLMPADVVNQNILRRFLVVLHSFCSVLSSVVPHSFFWSMLPSEVLSVHFPQLILQYAALWGPQWFLTSSSAVYCPLRSSMVLHSFFCNVLPSEVFNNFCSVLRSWGPQWLLQCAALLRSSMTSAMRCALEVLNDFCSVLLSWGPQWLLQCPALLRSSMTSAVCCPLEVLNDFCSVLPSDHLWSCSGARRGVL